MSKALPQKPAWTPAGRTATGWNIVTARGRRGGPAGIPGRRPDGSVPDEDVLELIDHSYDLVVAQLTKAQRDQLIT
jgi:hypothetical protein